MNLFQSFSMREAFVSNKLSITTFRTLILGTLVKITFVSWRLRSHGLVVRADTSEARGSGFDSSSDQRAFSLPGYKEVGIKWIQI